MGNYIIWTSKHHSDKMVQVLSKCDLLDVQEHFIKEGYFIVETFIGKEGDYFFVIRRPEDV